LKRALRVAHAAQTQAAAGGGAGRRGAEGASAAGHLFVEILAKYLYFFDRGVEGITPQVVNGVLELAASEAGGEACREDAALQALYRATLAAAAARRAGGGPAAARYAELAL
jgi:hypothetical protein